MSIFHLNRYNLKFVQRSLSQADSDDATSQTSKDPKVAEVEVKDDGEVKVGDRRAEEEEDDEYCEAEEEFLSLDESQQQQLFKILGQLEKQQMEQLQQQEGITEEKGTVFLSLRVFCTVSVSMQIHLSESDPSQKNQEDDELWKH